MVEHSSAADQEGSAGAAPASDPGTPRTAHDTSGLYRRRSRVQGDCNASFTDMWFPALNAKLKRQVQELFAKRHGGSIMNDDRARSPIHRPPLRGDATAATLQYQSGRQSPWALELAALQLVVKQMREELQSAHVREKNARYLAFHDDLTALPNRRHFLERLGVALRSNRTGPVELAVIYLDLDGFKALNDSHGHDTGDHVLKLVAARLARAVRAGDLVGRLGGDEFACLITGVINRERLSRIASTLFDAVSTPFKVDNLTLIVQPSIGIALHPVDGTTTDELMRSADAAMYAAKRTRSGTSFVQRAHRAPLHAVP